MLEGLTAGRRWNVLRHRTDSHEFDLDTLFLGTLLFTVTAFLAPTVLAYGLLFALVSGLLDVDQYRMPRHYGQQCPVLALVLAGEHDEHAN